MHQSSTDLLESYLGKEKEKEKKKRRKKEKKKEQVGKRKRKGQKEQEDAKKSQQPHPCRGQRTLPSMMPRYKTIQYSTVQYSTALTWAPALLEGGRLPEGGQGDLDDHVLEL